MKGKTGLCLALLLLITLLFPGQGRASEDPSLRKLTVGTATPFDGCFFTEMWGNSATDLDVRTLLHGYDLVEWDAAQGLFRIDPSVVSGVAVTQNSSQDRTYVLTICQDLYYCDGTPITAEDYAFSLLLSLSPEMAELGAGIKKPEYIKGCRAYVDKKAACLSGVRILDSHILSITVSHEYLPFFYELALLDCTPYPIDVIAPGCRVADDGEGVYITNKDRTVKEPLFTPALLRRTILDEEKGYLSHPSVTSGPYRLLSFDGETAEFGLNTYYKGNAQGERPSIERLVYKALPAEAMIESLKRGELDLVNKCVNASVIDDGMELVRGSQGKENGATATGGFSMSRYPRSGMSFISFCCEQEPVDSLRVRQAIASCMDKDAIADEYVGGYGLRVDGCYGMGQWMYQLLNGTIPYPVRPPADTRDKEGADASEKALNDWKKVNLDRLTIYDLNIKRAGELLEQDGWIWNERGQRYDPKRDPVRCRRKNNRYEPLELTLVIPEGNTIASCLEEHFGKYLKEAGMKLTIRTLPMNELLDQYYRQADRDCQMIYLASNFDRVFDPSESYGPDPAGTGSEAAVNRYNTTALQDRRLYERAVDMRCTSPGDVLGYCRKWVGFQERFSEVLPMIPVYSNVYYDFYTRSLQGYNISSNISWGQAVIHAYLSDPGDE